MRHARRGRAALRRLLRASQGPAEPRADATPYDAFEILAQPPREQLWELRLDTCSCP